MNDKNFDSLKNLKAPENWIENAINIPNTEEKPKPVFFLRYSKSLAAVACLVLVCIVSLFFALNKDRAVLPIEPSSETVPSDTFVNDETQNFTDATKHETSQNDKPTTNSNGENGGAPFEGDINNDNSHNKPTSPSQKPGTDPTSSDGSTGATQAPDEKPTDLPTVKPTKPSPEKPSTKPTDDPHEPVFPGKPYEPPTEGEGAGPDIPDSNIFYTSFSTRYLDSCMQIYCSVEDPDGNLVVNYDQATVYNTDKYLAYVSYTLPSYAVTKSGRYRCNFYTANGEYICSSTTYVQK